MRRSGPLTALRSGESLDASAGNGNVRERLRARCFRMGEVELRREHVERASAATR